jgi:ADP-ribose pyrophosphatase YjhB (NUDIX family)
MFVCYTVLFSQIDPANKVPQFMDILNKIKQIQSLTEIGIHYARNDFDLKRYEEISDLCFSVLSQITEIPETQLKEKMIESDGYKTPKVDVRAVVFNDRDEFLMVKEKIDDCWSLPGGWADIGYSPSEVAEKETREEAGADVKAVRLLGILDKRCHDHPSDIYYIYKVFIECAFIGWVGSDDMETSDHGFFSPDNLPPLSTPRNTVGQMQKLFDYRNGTVTEPMFD